MRLFNFGQMEASEFLFSFVCMTKYPGANLKTPPKNVLNVKICSDSLLFGTTETQFLFESLHIQDP